MVIFFHSFLYVCQRLSDFSPSFRCCLPSALASPARLRAWPARASVCSWPKSPSSSHGQLGLVGNPSLGKKWLPSGNLTDIAIENGPFIDGLPIKNGDFPWLC